MVLSEDLDGCESTFENVMNAFMGKMKQKFICAVQLHSYELLINVHFWNAMFKDSCANVCDKNCDSKRLTDTKTCHEI